MTTKLGTLNDLALPPPETDTAANSSSRYKSRRQVSHEDGPDATFWNTSYFIPGISGPARCLEDARDGILENNKPKTRRKPKTSNESAVTSVSRSSLMERSWCTPKALVRGVNRKESMSTKGDEDTSSWQMDSSSPSQSTESNDKTRACSSLPNDFVQASDKDEPNEENSVLPQRSNSMNDSLVNGTSASSNVEQDLEKLFQEFRAQRQSSKGSE
jgi:hypothetical protein